MRQVDDALQLMKEAYRERMEACDERQAQLEFKQAKMREQVAKFEKFIHENDAKRQRAGTMCLHARVLKQQSTAL